MKKYIITILLFLIILTNIFGQRTAFYDAFYLKSIVEANGAFKISAELNPIFQYYFNPGFTDRQLDSAIQANPFLDEYYQTAGIQSIPSGLSLPGIVSSIGGLNVTDFADGLARFLVERSKEELNVAFFRKFQEYFKSYPEVKIIML